MKLIARSSSPASAGSTRSSISRPQRGVPARIRIRSSSSSPTAAPPWLGVEQLDRRDAVVGVRDAPSACRRARRWRRAARARSCSGGEARAQKRRLRALPPSSGSVSSRKSSAPRRSTTSGAITRAFAVRSSASHALADTERLDVVRDHALQVVGGIRAAARATNPRAAAVLVTTATVTRSSLAAMFRSRAEKKVARAGYDPARLPPGQYLTEKWPVLHAGSVPLPGRPRQLGLPRVGRGRARRLTLTGRSSPRYRASSVTQDIHCVTRWSRFDATFAGVPWSAIAPARAARSRPRTSPSPTPSRASPRTCRPTSLERSRARCSPPTPTASRSTPEHGWPLRLVVPGKLLLEERQVAARHRAHRRRPAGLLGALRVPQRRRPLGRAALFGFWRESGSPPTRARASLRSGDADPASSPPSRGLPRSAPPVSPPRPRSGPLSRRRLVTHAALSRHSTETASQPRRPERRRRRAGDAGPSTSSVSPGGP